MGDFAVKNQSEPTTPSTGYTKFWVDAITKLLTLKKDDGSVQVFDPNLAATFDSVLQTVKIGNPTHIDSLNEYINHMWSSGVVHGCALVDNLDGSVNITTGFAVSRTVADAHTQLYPVEVPAQNNIILIDKATNYIYLDLSTGTPVFNVGLSTTSFNCLDKCLVYVVYRDGVNLDYIDASQMTVDSNTKQRRLFLDFARFIHKDGGTILSGVPATRNIAVTAGSFYFMVNKIDHASFNTSTGSTFTYYYRNGVGGFNQQITQTQINNTQYDNGTGTLATMANNKFRVDEVWMINNEPSRLVVVFGQAEYSSLAEAIASPTLSVIPEICNGLGVRIGRTIIEKSATVLADVQSSFTAQFTSSTATVHNSLAGLDGGEVGYYGHLSNSAQTITGEKTFANDLVTSAKLLPNGDIGDITGTKFSYDSVNNSISLGAVNPSPTVYKMYIANDSGDLNLFFKSGSRNSTFTQTAGFTQLQTNITAIKLLPKNVSMFYCTDTHLSFGNNYNGDANYMLGLKGATSDATKYCFQTIDSTTSQLFSIRNDGVVNSRDGYYVAGTKVIGTQQAAIANATGTATGTNSTVITDLQTKLNAALAALRAHGIIAT